MILDDSNKRISKHHRPMLPRYRSTKLTERTLSMYEGHRLYSETGEVFDIHTLDDMCNAVFDNNLLVYTNSIVALPFLDDIIHNDKHDVYCTERGQPSIGILGYKSMKRFIIKASTWHDDYVSPEFIKSRRATYDYVGVGVKPTPSSLGKETLRLSLVELGVSFTCASRDCEVYIKQHGSGGIVATPGLKTRHQSVMLLDMKSAYPSKFYRLPVGTSIWAYQPDFDNFPLWFAQCKVTIPHDLDLGPFPMRVLAKSASSRVVYPTSKGVYDAYLWSFQKDDCERVGCTVEPGYGWAWEKTTNDTLFWVDKMYRLRQQAPNEEVAKYIKIITNAAIGALGSDRIQYSLKPTESEEDTVCINDEGEPIDYYIHPNYDYHSPIMTHWWHSNISLTNSAVFNFALPYAQSNRLLSVDYDSIIVLEGDEKHLYPEKKSAEDMVAPMGSWSCRVLHDCYIPGARSYQSIEETKGVGVRMAS